MCPAASGEQRHSAGDDKQKGGQPLHKRYVDTQAPRSPSRVCCELSLCLSTGWKLNPVVGAVYGPELYAGKPACLLSSFFPSPAYLRLLSAAANPGLTPEFPQSGSS